MVTSHVQWGSKVWAPQLKICINVHKEAKERWKNLQKASNYRLDILIICQQKLDFISIIYTFKITENKKMASAKVWAPCRIYSMHCPLYQAETCQCHRLFSVI
ncbi:unnamed protein product, partial [Staurois parvus]